ncbi:MAG: hypothetical protein QY314_04735 [Candidatus Dojkabacteria bacterium]|nr:MAG: hypothetical protein QY314_04735 [Candidatus Dojkabacteria bacterium]
MSSVANDLPRNDATLAKRPKQLEAVLVEPPVVDIPEEGMPIDEWLEKRNYIFDPGETLLFIEEVASSIAGASSVESSSSPKGIAELQETLFRRAERLNKVVGIHTSNESHEFRQPSAQLGQNGVEYNVLGDAIFLKSNTLQFAMIEFNKAIEAAKQAQLSLPELEALDAMDRFQVTLILEDVRAKASHIAKVLWQLPNGVNKEDYGRQLAEAILVLDPLEQTADPNHKPNPRLFLTHAARYQRVIEANFRNSGDTDELVENADAYGLFVHELRKAPSIIQNASYFILRQPKEWQKHLRPVRASIQQSIGVLRLGRKYFEKLFEEGEGDDRVIDLTSNVSRAVEDFRNTQVPGAGEFPIIIEGFSVNGMRINPESLQRSITEILINARKYANTPQGVRITIEDYKAEYTGKLAARIRIRDFGPGCADPRTMWEAGIRQADDPNIQGTGLGLFMVKMIMKQKRIDYQAKNVEDGYGGLEITLSQAL